MSLALTDLVLDASAVRGGVRNVLLVMAHHANKDTHEAFPSISLVAKRAQLSIRQVQYHLRTLERLGVLDVLETGQGRGKRRIWRVVPEALVAAGDAATWREWREKVQHPDPEKVQDQHEKGAAHAGARGVTLGTLPPPPPHGHGRRATTAPAATAAPSLPGLAPGEEGLSALGSGPRAAGRTGRARRRADQERADARRLQTQEAASAARLADLEAYEERAMTPEALAARRELRERFCSPRRAAGGAS